MTRLLQIQARAIGKPRHGGFSVYGYTRLGCNEIKKAETVIKIQKRVKMRTNAIGGSHKQAHDFATFLKLELSPAIA